MLSITTLKSSQGKPYQTTLKCVIATRSDPINYQKDGTKKSMMYVGLCDHSGHIKAILYDLAKLDKITNLTTVIIKNFILRLDHTLALTTQTKIFKTAPLELPDHIITEATNSVHPPTPPPQPIKTVKTSPIKTTTSVKGSVKQVHLPHFLLPRIIGFDENRNLSICDSMSMCVSMYVCGCFHKYGGQHVA
ncbi:hypothetical protein HOLleu_13626 [Holothuria leucospilota]|uniref:Uncharacterized protein n=1 Tax=Holothuria leucospilota TaxID=206669 RepID=A0A9Q1CDI7_HOLLE|nr:hypothetical protein HOLleu_13626 [Holothuria leucospilota]